MGPDMATIERCLKNFSLNGDSSGNCPTLSSGVGVDLNSQLSLPYHWEQCLDLKTGEVYYINWRTGMKVKEDPRKISDCNSNEEDDEDYDDQNYSSYGDSEESSSDSSSIPCPRENKIYQVDYHNNSKKTGIDGNKRESHVMVVAGCKSCFMYVMAPKQESVCPKCCGQLLHFDQSQNNSV